MNAENNQKEIKYKTIYDKNHPNNHILKLVKLKKLPENPLVSITIAAYNEERHVENAIKSLLKQTYKNIEIIIANDASTDKTPEIIKKYKKQGVKLVSNKERGGEASAYNLGWRNSKGRVLMFFDADLIYGENYVKDMLKPIMEEKDIAAMHNLETIGNIDNLWARAFAKVRPMTKDGRGVIFTFIRRDVFDKLGPFDSKYGYSDDQTLHYKYNLTSLGVDTSLQHFNPDSLIAHWRHGQWVGRSFTKPWKTIATLPVFPLWIIYRLIKQFKKDPYPPFLYFLPLYFTVKYFAYLKGAIQRVRGLVY